MLIPLSKSVNQILMKHYIFFLHLCHNGDVSKNKLMQDMNKNTQYLRFCTHETCKDKILLKFKYHFTCIDISLS